MNVSVAFKGHSLLNTFNRSFGIKPNLNLKVKFKSINDILKQSILYGITRVSLIVKDFFVFEVPGLRLENFLLRFNISDKKS